MVTTGRILWALMDPASLVPAMLVVSVGLLAWRRTRVTLGVAAASLVATLLCMVLPLGRELTCAVESLNAPTLLPTRIDALVLLGGSEDVVATEAHGRPAFNDAADRLLAVAELARAFPDARVVVTGGHPTPWRAGPAEAEVARDQLVRLGVDGRRITVDDRSRNTAESGAALAPLLATLNPQHVVLVTSALHMPRAWLTFQPHLPGAVALPVDHRCSGSVRWFAWDPVGNLAALSSSLHEVVGLVSYRLRGITPRMLP